MIEDFKNVFMTLRGMNIYLEVILGAFLAYFWLRGVKDMNPKLATWIPFGVALLGQFAYEIQDNVSKGQAIMNTADFIMALFMAFFTGGAASMVYSMADKYGWIDKVGVAIGKKIDKDSPTTTPTP